MCKAETVQTILVLFGGCSTEHEVSLQSAAAVLEHIDPTRFRALPVGDRKSTRQNSSHLRSSRMPSSA